MSDRLIHPFCMSYTKSESTRLVASILIMLSTELVNIMAAGVSLWLSPVLFIAGLFLLVHTWKSRARRIREQK